MLNYIALVLVLIGQVTTIPARRFYWDQEAPDLATARAYTYTYYPNNTTTGIVLTGVSCENKIPAVTGKFDCFAYFPYIGIDSISISARVGNTEYKSPAFDVNTAITAPTNIRLLK